MDPRNNPMPGSSVVPSANQNSMQASEPTMGTVSAQSSANVGFDSMTNGVATPNPVSTPVAPAPANSVPVNPVINPSGNTAVNNPAPVNPVFQPNSDVKVAATDPIMMPDPAPVPDPIEEELKAPMKAAGPVPGSIGSAVSLPATGAVMPDGVTPAPMNANDNMSATPSVSFNDPANEQSGMMAMANQPVAAKKQNKTTMIVLIAVAAVVVVALAVVLIMSL